MNMCRREGISEERLVIRSAPVRPLHTPAPPVVTILKHVCVLRIYKQPSFAFSSIISLFWSRDALIACQTGILIAESVPLTYGPEVALPFPSAFAGDFNEALVQRQIVPDGVLPALLVFLEIREPGSDVGVNLAERRPFLSAVLDRHGNQRDVTERWLLAGRIVGATVSGSGPGSWSICDSGGRRWRWRRRGVAVGGAVKRSGWRWTLFVQMMMTGAGRVHGHPGSRAVQAVMRMVMRQRGVRG